MTPAILFAATLAAATYTLIPGPAFLALLGIGASSGRRPAAGFIGGHFAGDIVWATLALVSIIGAHVISRTFFDFLGLVCGLYLFWLGMTAIRARRDAAGRFVAAPRHPILRGAIFGLTNPKGYPVAVAMFTALLAGYADQLDWSSFMPLLAAGGAGFILADIVLVFFVGADWVRHLYSRYDIWVERASGLIFIGFALHALSEAIPGLLGWH